MEFLKQAVKDTLKKVHTSGRRENRLDVLNRDGQKTYYRPDPKRPKRLLPIQRAQPRRPAGVSARQWKRLRGKGQGARVEFCPTCQQARVWLESGETECRHMIRATETV